VRRKAAGAVPARATRAGRVLRPLASVLVLAVVLGGVGLAIHGEQQAGEKLWRAEESARLARAAGNAAQWRALADRGDLAASLARCRDSWQGELGLHQDPVALAYTRVDLTAYFLDGADRSSVRQVGCGARGVSRGGRYAHPLQNLLPAEAPAVAAEADAEGDATRELLRLASRTLEAGELGVELVADPLRGRVLQRRWISSAQGVEVVLEPADAPVFALLAGSQRLRPTVGAAPPPLQPLTRQHWLAQPAAAFSVIEKQMPAAARVSELTLDDDKIELSIQSPTPAFDGKPPAPFGDRRLDEYGIADMDWWYPRDDPGFGCRSGQPLAAVRASFEAAWAGLGDRPLARAWYSCSTAYGNGRTGAWHLQAR
jgi:hypothetical protein